MASGTAWQSPIDGSWLQTLSIDFSSTVGNDPNDFPRDAKSCEEEIEHYKNKNQILRRKVRRAKGEERKELDRIEVLEREIQVLESRLAEKLHNLKDDDDPDDE